ncbi:MAG: DUF11 domain-containing protein, partial [Caldilineaceae bacterium]|nr:DUF11 domain-containing protein [Caldilineaceae bacterium]
MKQRTPPPSIQVAANHLCRDSGSMGIRVGLHPGLRLSVVLLAASLFMWLSTGVSYAQDISVSVSPNPAEVSEPVVATITFTNTGAPLASVPLTMTYDTLYVSYNSVAGSNPPSYGLTDGGVITWTDASSGAGLGTGSSLQVVVNLTAKDAIPSTNIMVSGPNATSGQGALTINEPPGKYQISGYIWHDINNSGTDSRDTSNPNEPLIPGVVVELYRDNDAGGSPFVWDATDALITTTVAADGTYTFTNVVGDGITDFIVRLAPSNFNPGGPLDGFIISDSLTDPATNSQPVTNLNTNVTGVNFGLYCRFDLALVKQLASGQSNTIAPGDDITFTLTITNQGIVPAENMVLVDYLPTGFTLSAAETDWTNGSAGMATTALAGPLAGGESTTVDIILTAGAAVAGGMYTNTAEIAAADSVPKDLDGNSFPDADSTPDMVNGNGTNGNGGEDADLENDQVNEDGKVAGQDEDDHDPEPFTVAIYDLALIKELAAGQVALVQPSDVVSFTITVKNQGTVSAGNFTVTDQIPSGMSYAGFQTGPVAAGSSCTGAAANPIFTCSIADLAPGGVITVTLAVRIDDATQSPFRNWAEISADSGDDIDSTPDTNTGIDNGVGFGTGPNDPVVNHNDIDHTAPNNNPLVDEDDNDYEDVSTSAVYDLALVKALAPGQSPFVNQGDTVNYLITVQNQGNLPSGAFTVADYIPAGMSYAGMSSSPFTVLPGGGIGAPNVSGSMFSIVITDMVPAETMYITLTLRVDDASQGPFRNVTEITSDSGNDVDSTPDGDPLNDPVIDHNDITHSGPTYDEPTEDEDDHDIEMLYVPSLAITKVRNGVNPFGLGDSISFTIRITNTGSVTITVLPLEDTYNNAFFAYDGGNPPTPAPDSATPGVLNWNDLLAGNAAYPNGLGIGQSMALDVYFVARADTGLLPATAPCVESGEAPNVVHVMNAMADLDGPGGMAPVMVIEDADDHDCDSAQIFNPTAVTLAERSATQQADGVMVRWSTVSESDIVGFHLWKSNGVHAEQLTTTMITAQKAGQSSGASYEWLHVGAQLNRGDAYLLELVKANGTT